MRNASSDRVRMETLTAVDQSPADLLPAFVSAGGLPVLGRWIRTVPSCRFACLTILTNMPAAAHDIQAAKLSEAVAVAACDDREGIQQLALELLEAWRAKQLIEKSEGLLEETSQ